MNPWLLSGPWADGPAPFVDPWPITRRAVWQDAAADERWIMEAGRRAQLEILLELDRRFARILLEIADRAERAG